MIRSFTLFLLIPAVFPALSVSVAAETATEQWVRKRVSTGQSADLMEYSPRNPGRRELGAVFLAKLLATKSGLDDSRGIAVKHGIVRGELDLERLEAMYDVDLDGFEFDSRMNLSGAHFHRSLTIRRSVFKSDIEGYRLVVDEDLALCGPPLNMPSDHAEAYFEREVSLKYATVGNLYVQRSHFHGPVDFSAIAVHGRGVFESSVFDDTARFTMASFDGDLDLMRAKFGRKDGEAIFNSVRVGYLADFSGSEFDGDVDFGYMQISSSFQAKGMTLNNAERSVRFSGMKTGKLYLEKADFSRGFVQMIGLVSATELDLRNVRWPFDPNRFVCEDVSYTAMKVTVNGVPALQMWPASSRYSASTYAGLAKYLEDHGDSKRASDVRVDGAMRAGRTLDLVHQIWSRLEFLTCGYGKRPWYAFFWIAAFVWFGWRVFRDKLGMELIEPGKPDPGYDPFWYSLGLFLPVVDIGLIKAWRPNHKRRFAHHYAQVHVLLGWVFVPIAVASITGILK